MSVHKLVALAAAAAVGWPCAAAAQSQEAPPVVSPIRVESDHNGVNVATGRMTIEGPVLSVPAAPNLRFDRVQNAAPYVTGTITGGISGPVIGNYNVHAGAGASESFRCTEALCESVTGTGSVYLVDTAGPPDERQYRQAGSGVRYYFDKMHFNSPDPTGRRLQYYASRVVWPNGEVITYTYDTGGLTGLARTFYRPRRIASNMGYHIELTYPVQYMDHGITEWSTPNTATLYRTAAPEVPLRRLTYAAGAVTDSGDTIADTSDDRIYSCCGSTLGAPVEAASGTLQLPGEGSAALQVAAGTWQNSPLIQTVTRDGVPWTYSYATPRQPDGTLTWVYDSVTVTGPDGFNQVYHMTQGGSLYAPFNLVAGITDSLGRTTSYEIDAVTYRPTRVTYPEGNAVSVVYDDAGNVISRTAHARPGSGTSPATITERAHYPLPAWPQFCDTACWRPAWSQNGLGRQTDYAYNDRGQLTEQLDPADANGVRRRTSIFYALSSSGISRRGEVRVCADTGASCGANAPIRTEYQYWGDTLLVSRERRIDGATGQPLDTTHSYDAEGRLLSTDGPLPGTADVTYNRYDAFGRRTWEIGALAPNGLRLVNVHAYRDSDDKIFVSVAGFIGADPQSVGLTTIRRTDYFFDSRRNVFREATYAPGPVYHRVVDREHDDRGRLVCEAVRMNPAANAELPGGCAHTTEGSGGPDRITRNVYDAAGQRLQVREGVGTAIEAATATWAYNLNGQVTTMIDGNGNRAEMTYDGFGRQRRWILPHAGAGAPNQCGSPGAANPCDYEEYGYDAAGNRISLRKRDGSLLEFQYDNLNRLIRKTVPERPGLDPIHTRDVHYGYDLRNAQLFARFDSPAGEGMTYGYDGFGRQVSSWLLMDGVTRGIGRIYDDINNSVFVQHPSGYAFTYHHDALGRLSSISGGVGAPATLATFTYNAQGLPATRADGPGSAVAYAYDALGRPTSLADSFTGGAGNVTLGFGYNRAGQITSLSRSNDAYAWTGAVTVNRAYTTNGLNQYTAAGPAAFTYDANGNLTSDGSTNFTYDVENRLVAASGSRTAALRYDPLGRLYEVTGAAGWTRFLYDGDALVEEYIAAGIAHVYVHGSNAGADDPLIWCTSGTIRWLRSDHQGSITGTADPQGNLASINSYDEYGIPAATNYSRFQYTGQAWLAELGMYHYKARIYSPTLGRFLQTDPVGYEDQMNLYAYVGNDPMNRVDPTGLATLIWNSNNDVHVIFYVKMVAVPGASFRFTGDQLGQRISTAVQGPTKFEGRIVNMTSSVVIVPVGDNTTGGSDLTTMTQHTAQTMPQDQGGNSFSRGREINLAPDTPLTTAAHEVPHPAGAGDQRVGGVDADGNVIPLTAGPFEDGLMNMGQAKTNDQTRGEILRSRNNIHIRTRRPQD